MNSVETHSNLLGRFTPLTEMANEQLNIDDMPSLDQIWTYAKPNIQNARKDFDARSLDNETLYNLIHMWLDLAKTHEVSARSVTRWKYLEVIAPKTALIVDFSAPGTYFMPSKDDPYKNEKYTRYWDRQRADIAAKTAIIAAGLKTNNDFSAVTQTPFLTGFEPEFSQHQSAIRNAIFDSGIQLWYYGNKQECSAIDQALKRPRSYVPAENVRIHSAGIKDTLTQVHQLGADLRANLQTPKNPDGILTPGSHIVMPSHSQSIRMLCMMQRYNTIPEGINLAIMPIATPKEGLKPYIQNELSKTAYSVITRIADPQPADHMILGG